MATVLARAHQRSVLHVKNVVKARVATIFREMPDYRDPELFATKVAPVVEAGQGAAVSLMDSYLARAIKGTVVGLDKSKLTGAAVRNGADPLEVYQRPLRGLYYDLSQGRGFGPSVEKALLRTLTTAETDIQLASRASAVAYGLATDGAIRAWERVPDDAACTFCLLAATQRYWIEDLQPLHDRCNCTVDPQTGESRIKEITDERLQMGQVVNPQYFEQLGADGVKVSRGDGTTYVWTMKDGSRADAAVAIRDHGELGPVLTDPRDNFRGPADVAADEDA